MPEFLMLVHNDVVQASCCEDDTLFLSEPELFKPSVTSTRYFLISALEEETDIGKPGVNMFHPQTNPMGILVLKLAFIALMVLRTVVRLLVSGKILVITEFEQSQSMMYCCVFQLLDPDRGIELLVL